MFKSGDKVKIKSAEHINEIVYNMVGHPGFAESMEKYCSKVTTVIDCVNAGSNDKWVHLHIDNGKFAWDVRWMETVRHHVDLQLNNEMFEI